MCRNYMEDHPDFASECSAFLQIVQKECYFAQRVK